jgi:wyosine [tRNA(Phe)-imidazoG37] synthetase (radical SAM superfamily)
MHHEGFRYLFGPVFSRRFGVSLGVDLLGQRVCSFNCIFCEAGPTQTCTFRRDAYTPLGEVLGEIRAWFGAGGAADVVTLAGRGEPTLHTGFGAVIDAIHDAGTIPVVLLSNGSLFPDPDVRDAARRADIVKVSLGGWDDDSVARLNRPAAGLCFSDYVAGLRAFRSEYGGQLRLEVMLVRGVNDAPDDVRCLAEYARSIGADKIELNTVARPPAEKTSLAVPDEVLQQYAGLFGPMATVIASRAGASGAGAASSAFLADRVLALLARRGCRLEEIALGLAVSEDAVSACLELLRGQGRIIGATDPDPYYRLPTPS